MSRSLWWSETSGRAFEGIDEARPADPDEIVRVARGECRAGGQSDTGDLGIHRSHDPPDRRATRENVGGRVRSRSVCKKFFSGTWVAAARIDRTSASTERPGSAA